MRTASPESLAGTGNATPAWVAGGDALSGEPAQDGAVLQSLIDAAAGAVDLPAGTYLLRDSLRLRSGLLVRAGGQVVLRRAPVAESALVQIAGYGHRELCVAEPELFDLNTGVCVTDSSSGGFAVTLGRVVAKTESALIIDTALGRDFRPANGAKVRSIFPMVAGYGVERAGIEGVKIVGDGNESYLDGCRDAGVYLIGCSDVTLQSLEITRYAGDAISFQQCVDVRVAQCRIGRNAGHGVHPGSGSVRYVIEENDIQENGGCGIFYCLRTTHSVCRRNRIRANGAAGISVGERDTNHLIEDNRLESNAAEGVLFRRPAIDGGNQVVVRGNSFVDNDRAGKRTQILVESQTHDVHVIGNQFDDVSGTAIGIGRDCMKIVLANNTRHGEALPPEAVDACSSFAAVPLASLPSTGPTTLGELGALHLGIRSLAPWRAGRAASATDI